MAKYNSIFDIIGPVMVGPSSSHTAGAVYLGRFARQMYGQEPESAKITFYGSFAHTYRGHGTDVAIIAGILGLKTFDERIPRAYELAAQADLKLTLKVSKEPVNNPNTALIELSGKAGKMSIMGVSIGGGAVEIINIDGFPCHLNGELPTVLVIHQDKFGVIAAVSRTIANYMINVARMEVSRHEKGKRALMIIETDEKLSDILLDELKNLQQVQGVIAVNLQD